MPWVAIANTWRRARTFHFCPDCGATVFLVHACESTDVVAVPIGAVPGAALKTTVSVFRVRHIRVAMNATMKRATEHARRGARSGPGRAQVSRRAVRDEGGCELPWVVAVIALWASEADLKQTDAGLGNAGAGLT